LLRSARLLKVDSKWTHSIILARFLTVAALYSIVFQNRAATVRERAFAELCTVSYMDAGHKWTASKNPESVRPVLGRNRFESQDEMFI
jgi:hypothetical protein